MATPRGAREPDTGSPDRGRSHTGESDLSSNSSTWTGSHGDQEQREELPYQGASVVYVGLIASFLQQVGGSYLDRNQSQEAGHRERESNQNRPSGVR